MKNSDNRSREFSTEGKILGKSVGTVLGARVEVNVGLEGANVLVTVGVIDFTNEGDGVVGANVGAIVIGANVGAIVIGANVGAIDTGFKDGPTDPCVIGSLRIKLGVILRGFCPFAQPAHTCTFPDPIGGIVSVAMLFTIP